jgi:hypothetical protein
VFSSVPFGFLVVSSYVSEPVSLWLVYVLLIEAPNDQVSLPPSLLVGRLIPLSGPVPSWGVLPGVAKMKSKATSNVSQHTPPSGSRTALGRGEGRQYPRKKLSLPVIVESGKRMIKGRIVDLSLSGAFMLLPDLPDPIRPVSLTIDLPGVEPLVLSAELVRFEICPEAGGSFHQYGLAVRFVSLSSEHRLVLFNSLRI